MIVHRQTDFEVGRCKDPDLLKEIGTWWHEQGHLDLNQRDFLIETLKALKPKWCLEIGFASGRSGVTTLLAAQPERLISIDISLDYIPGSRQHASRLQQHFPNLTVVEGDSPQVLTREFLLTRFPNGLDFVFVDGDHSYAGCRSDLVAVLPHLNPDGFILVDDYRSGPPNGVTFRSVTRAVDEFVLRNGLALRRWRKDGKGIAVIRRTRSPRERLVTAPGCLVRIAAYRLRLLGGAARRGLRNCIARRPAPNAGSTAPPSGSSRVARGA